ncbi:MAG: AMP-binding protein [Nibricoccus sp.]
MSAVEPTDSDRYPLLTPEGRRMLDFLREHPRAPVFRNRSGNRLSFEDLACVRNHEAEVLSGSVGWPRKGRPEWFADFVSTTCREVPHFRAYARPECFEDLPTISRADFGRDIAAFVPDSVPVERMINFQTSGTTGHPLLIASHPRVAAGYLAYHKRALQRFGITLTARRGEVGVVLLGFQQTCFTYVSVTPTMDEAGLAKINLHPSDWRDPSDRIAYLSALAPEVIAGDPLSFAELLRLNPVLRPKALLCTSMTLLPGLRQKLEIVFACPVLDLYSLNEAGPIAVFDQKVDGHVILQPRLYVEILDPSGRPVPEGQRGEITLTGGFNFCLPLLRYRTGDFASLTWRNNEPVLQNLEGRAVVRFRKPDGSWLNNIDVTHRLRPFPIARFAVHQRADAAFNVSIDATEAIRTEALAALAGLFGTDARIEIIPFPPIDGKTVQYSSALPDPDA